MTATADAAGVAVDLWLPRYPAVPLYLSGIRKIAESFHELHPEYVVNVRESSYKTLPEDVYTASREGRPPALVQYFHTSTQLARDMLSGAGDPLFTTVHAALGGRTEILGHPVVTDDILATARAYYSYDGALMAVPPLISTTLLYANTDLLAAAGVARLPETWDEVEAACKAVQTLPGVTHGITWPNHGWIFQQAVSQSGGLLADHGNGRLGRAETMLLDSPEMLAFAEWWQRMHREGRYLYTGNEAYGDTVQQAWEDNFTAFTDQRVAFILSSSVEADWLVQAGRERGFGVAAGRMFRGGDFPFAGNIVGGDAIWLVDGLEPEVRDGALAFLQYLLTPEHTAERHRDTWFAPGTGAAMELLERQDWFDGQPNLRVAVDQLAASDRSPAALGALIGEFGRVQGVMSHAMHDVLLRGEAPARRFASANSEAQRLLDEYNAQCLGTAPGPRGPRRFTVD